MAVAIHNAKVDVSLWPQGWIDFCSPCGVQHYRLLAEFGRIFKDKIFVDLGTLMGASSIALGASFANKIYSFDLPVDNGGWVVDGKPPFVENSCLNIEYIKDNFFNHMSILESAVLILVDIDHSGIQEEKLIKELSARNWKGLMILDDVKDGVLKNLARDSGYNYCDLTKYGHYEGTHMIDFSNEYQVMLI